MNNLYYPSSSSIGSAITGSIGSITNVTTAAPWAGHSFTIPDRTKENNLDKFAFLVESEDRMRMLLEKVSDKKLTVEEALNILKSDRAVKIG